MVLEDINLHYSLGAVNSQARQKEAASKINYMVLKMCLCSFMGKVGHTSCQSVQKRAHDGSLNSLRCFSASQSAGLRLKK